MTTTAPQRGNQRALDDERSTSEALGPSESNASAAPTLLPVLQFYRAKQEMTNNSTEQNKAKPSRTNCDSIAWLHFWFQTEGPAQSMA